MQKSNYNYCLRLAWDGGRDLNNPRDLVYHDTRKVWRTRDWSAVVELILLLVYRRFMLMALHDTQWYIVGKVKLSNYWGCARVDHSIFRNVLKLKGWINHGNNYWKYKNKSEKEPYSTIPTVSTRSDDNWRSWVALLTAHFISFFVMILSKFSLWSQSCFGIDWLRSRELGKFH